MQHYSKDEKQEKKDEEEEEEEEEEKVRLNPSDSAMIRCKKNTHRTIVLLIENEILFCLVSDAFHERINGL
ncbi:MAG: hypothetical protein JNN26_27455 [Candidatus Obscuribacter sp.]|nr:hypothetical protein [Candidatus Obscuribacter sp.]